jgi:hypothetical protein
MLSRRRRSRKDLFRNRGWRRPLPKRQRPPRITSLSNEGPPSASPSIESPSSDLDRATGKLLPFRPNHSTAPSPRNGRPPGPEVNAVPESPLPSIVAGMDKTEKAKYARRRVLVDSIPERILDQIIILLEDSDAH